MTTNEYLIRVNQLLLNAEREEALSLLLELFGSKKAYQAHHSVATHLQAQLADIKKKELSGLLTQDELQVAQNRVQDKILQLAKAIEDPSQLKELSPVVTDNTASKPWILWLIPAVLLLAFFYWGVPSLFDQTANPPPTIEALHLSGTVSDQNRKIIANATVMIDTFKVITTVGGDFSIKLPYPAGISKKITVKKNGQILYEGDQLLTNKPLTISIPSYHED